MMLVRSSSVSPNLFYTCIYSSLEISYSATHLLILRVRTLKLPHKLAGLADSKKIGSRDAIMINLKASFESFSTVSRSHKRDDRAKTVLTRSRFNLYRSLFPVPFIPRLPRRVMSFRLSRTLAWKTLSIPVTTDLSNPYEKTRKFIRTCSNEINMIELYSQNFE